MFFSPGLPTLNLFKLVILMYIRSWAVMTCNVPHETVFRASRSNNFYFALLLFMLFLCTLPVAFGIVWLEPSWHCGPFSQYSRIYHILTKAILSALPEYLHEVVDYLASPGIVIPLLVLLILIIYYLLSLTGALREANNDLKFQLRRERTEERRKMFKIAGGKGKKEDPMLLWKKLIPMAKGDETIKSDKDKAPSILTTGKMTGFAGKSCCAAHFAFCLSFNHVDVFYFRIGAAKRAALKAKKQKLEPMEDDGNATDADQASLPEDPTGVSKTKPKPPTRKPSCTDSVASTRSEIPVIKISEEVEGITNPKPGTSAQHMTRTGSKVDPEKKKRLLKALIKQTKVKKIFISV